MQYLFICSGSRFCLDPEEDHPEDLSRDPEHLQPRQVCAGQPDPGGQARQVYFQVSPIFEYATLCKLGFHFQFARECIDMRENPRGHSMCSNVASTNEVLILSNDDVDNFS